MKMEAQTALLKESSREERKEMEYLIFQVKNGADLM
jgi:hypothetical protein